MKKFCVFSGFLGSGKTTTMMALTEYYTRHYGKAAMISNDLGHGVSLADHKLARLRGCNALEMTEDCICYQNEKLANTLNSLYESGCELVISDIPGFGVGALEHVYHGLREKFPDRYELAPFTVLVEPCTLELLRRGESGDMEYLHHTQLVEADLIVLNKCDTISPAERERDEAWLRAHYPAAEVICISAADGSGLAELALALRDKMASLRRPDIGYGGEAFRNAMGKISEYYFQYRALVCCDSFDGNAYLLELAEQVKQSITDAGHEIPHLKLLSWEPEGDYGKLDLIGIRRAIELTHRFQKPCTDIAVNLNASALCPSALLDEIITSAAYTVSEKYRLELTPFKKDCFGMGG